jgi:hypothetical protein
VTTIATPGADLAARQDLLERYARLAIRVGINLEPGREVAIRAMIEHAPLVHALVRAGYEAGARRVEVEYEDLEVLRSQIALAPDDAVGTAPRWMFERLHDVREQRRAQVFVIGIMRAVGRFRGDRRSPRLPGTSSDAKRSRLNLAAGYASTYAKNSTRLSSGS